MSLCVFPGSIPGPRDPGRQDTGVENTRRTSALVPGHSLSHVGLSAPGRWHRATHTLEGCAVSCHFIWPNMPVGSPEPGGTFPRAFRSDLDSSLTTYSKILLSDSGSWHHLPVMFMTSAKPIFEHFFNKLSRKSGHLFFSCLQISCHPVFFPFSPVQKSNPFQCLCLFKESIVAITLRKV